MNRPRVLLADDHRMVGEGLKHLLADEFELVGLAEDGRALVAMARDQRPDVVVSDISMPHLNGVDALERMKSDNPDIRVVFLTMHPEPAYATRALEAGACGFVVKHSAPEELVLAIHSALKGQTFVTPAIAGEMLRQTRNGTIDTDRGQRSLTRRQRDVLRFVAQGKSAKEIGMLLSISARTVEFHKYHVMELLGFHSNAELIRFAIQRGIV